MNNPDAIGVGLLHLLKKLIGIFYVIEDYPYPILEEAIISLNKK